MKQLKPYWEEFIEQHWWLDMNIWINDNSAYLRWMWGFTQNNFKL